MSVSNLTFLRAGTLGNVFVRVRSLLESTGGRPFHSFEEEREFRLESERRRTEWVLFLRNLG